MARSQAPARAPTAGAEVVPARAVASGLGDASATGIALHVRALIVSGRLAPGARLPTVRSLAGTLHVGPTTVAEAWAHLRDEGLLRSHGRHGVFVDGSASWRSGRPDAGDRLDLSRLWPDPALLPVPGPFLTRAAEELAGGPDGSRVDDVLRDPVLVTQLRRSWPFPAETFAVTSSVRAGLAGLLAQTTPPGTRVLVEEPFGYRDTLHAQGLRCVPVRTDDRGPVPESLARAAAVGGRWFVFQSRAALPGGHALDRGRAEELAALVEAHDLAVAELDTAGALGVTPAVSLGELVPHRTALLRSWPLSHGPQLRVGAVGGAARLVEPVRDWTLTHGTWPSSWHQRALARMLADPQVHALVARAGEVYAERHRRMVAALTDAGLAVPGGPALATWVRVRDAELARATLWEHGVAIVARGPWSHPGQRAQHVQVVTIPQHRRQPDVAGLLASLAA